MILGPSPVFPDIVPVLLAERRTADTIEDKLGVAHRELRL